MSVGDPRSGRRTDEPAGERRPGAPTIKDVAARAGVSKATVSKYLNVSHGYSVAPATRKRIEEAIEELEFRPSALARGLTRGATMTIGLVMADIASFFYPDLVAAVQRVVEKAGYTLVLGSTGGSAERELDIIRSMTHGRVDGLMLASVRAGSQDIRYLRNLGLPLVLAARDLPELVADTVVVDNVEGAVRAVEHLRALGHRRIGHVTGDLTVKPFLDRRRGFDQATADLPETPVATGPTSIEGGRLVTRELLSRAPRPTAVFFSNDTMALGGLMACADLGLDVPGDVSLVGFDDVSAARLPGIDLTTVSSATTWVGERAAELLLERILDPEVAETGPRLVVRSTDVVVRGSTRSIA